jgi:hypothetical protein
MKPAPATKTPRSKPLKIRKGCGLMPTRVHTPKTVYTRKKNSTRHPAPPVNLKFAIWISSGIPNHHYPQRTGMNADAEPPQRLYLRTYPASADKKTKPRPRKKPTTHSNAQSN